MGIVKADAALTITAITWNVVGLDSNNVSVGPNVFPVAGRVCNTGDAQATNVTSTFHWEDGSDATYINLRSGTNPSYLDGVTLDADECIDFYYEIEIKRDSTAYNHTRRYTITAAADGGLTASTPQPREIFVEHLVSQNRNSVTDLKLDGVSIPNGGAMSMVVGRTYNVQLVGSTSTNGYNQLESFINLPNTIFRINSVVSTYAVTSLTPPYDTLYADSCGWDDNPYSVTYRSCILSDGKTGGVVTTTYNITILSGGGSNLSMNTMLFDFSGSSYHYNSDFSSSARFVEIVDPTDISISKAFSPSSTPAGGTSILTFTLTNLTSSTIEDISFSDDLPVETSTPTSQMSIAATPDATTSGCGPANLTALSGTSVISFTGGAIAPNSTCTVSVRVNVPSSPTTGSYVNTSNHLYVGELDTGRTATATLSVSPVPAGVPACDLDFVQWTMPTTDTTPPTPTTNLSGGTAQISVGNGLSEVLDTSTGNLAGSLIAYGWAKNSTGFSTATSPYLQIAVDTKDYTNVVMEFDAQRKSNGPDNIFIYYSTNGTTWTQKNATAINAPTSSWGSYGAPTLDFTGQTSTTGVTYFRIYGWGANAVTSGNDINFDNITFNGCGTPQPPTISKSFSPEAVAVNGTSTLTFTITNPNSSSLSGIKFSDELPDGLEVASPATASTTCGGSPTYSPAPGDTTIDFGDPTGATLAGESSCNVVVHIKATTIGPHQNVSGFISSTEGGTNSGEDGSAAATLTALQSPKVTKLFSPDTILTDGTSTLTITITNPNPDDELPNVNFTDTFPATPGGMKVAAPLNTFVTGCGSPTFNPVEGAGSITFSGGTIPAGGSCVIELDVTAPTVGGYTNTIDDLTSTISGVVLSGNTATSDLTVKAPQPGIVLSKQVATTSSGPWSDYLIQSPGGNIYYRFIVENTGDVSLASVTVNDPDLSLASCTWPDPLPVASATQDPTATCVVGSISAEEGNHQNTATASGTYNSVVYTDSATAEYVGAVITASPGLTLIKQISNSPVGPWSSSIENPGTEVYYKFTIINTGNATLSPVTVTDPDPNIDPSECLFIDPLASGGATACVLGPVSASSTVGTYTNTATAHGVNGGLTYDSAESSASYIIAAIGPDLAITKANDTSDSGVVGTAFTWTITVSNDGNADAVFADTQLIVSDDLPSTASYASLSVDDSGITGTIDCTISAAPNQTISCNADGEVTIGQDESFVVTLDATPTASGTLSNAATVDPDDVIAETDETNNTSDTDEVTVSDAGTGSISGNVWEDTDGDGVKDAGEVGIQNVTIKLYEDDGTGNPTGAALDTAVTDADGAYTFSDVMPGEYVIVETNPTGYTSTGDTEGSNDDQIAVTLESDDSLTGNDFLDTQAGSVGGNVWEDTDGDGVKDAGEVGIQNVTIKLYEDDGTGNPTGAALDTAVTDADGAYTFSDVMPGKYVIVETNPTGYTSTGDTEGSNDDQIAVTLESGDSLTGNDFLDAQLGGITGKVWKDTDGDGKPDSGEDPISSVTISLYTDDGTGNPTGPVLKTIVTGSDGTYTFSGLLPGDYVVVETDPAGFASTTPNQVAVTVVAPDTQEVNFGDLPISSGVGSGTIHGYVVDDVNGNGVQDTGELPIAGVTINLYDGDGNLVDTTTTDADGFYEFTKLSPGSYTVVEEDPAGYVSTTLNTVVAYLTGKQVVQVDYYDQSDPLVEIADPAVTKYGSPEKAAVGSLVVFTITVGNTGNADATGVVLTDTKPSFLDIVSVLIDPPDGLKPVYSGNTFTINFGTIPPSAVYTITVVTRVNSQGRPSSGTNNVALVTSSATDRIFNDTSKSKITITTTSKNTPGTPGTGEVTVIPETGFAPGKHSILPKQLSSQVYTDSDMVLEIPGLGVSMTIVGVPLSEDGTTWDVTWLGRQAGYLQGTAFPTWKGNSVIGGHVYLSNGMPGPFYNLGNLSWGDRIIIHAFGQDYIYEIRLVDAVDPRDMRSLLKHEEIPWITLFTCKDYDEASDSYLYRTIVRAVLVSVSDPSD